MPGKSVRFQRGEVSIFLILVVFAAIGFIIFGNPSKLLNSLNRSPSPIPTVEVSPSPTESPAPSPSPTKSSTPKPSATSTPAPVSNNIPPGAGYSRQTVSTDIGTFTVSIVAADLGSTRVVVDTASASDCSNDCPVLPLATYATRNGAYAAINGSFFCPTAYPSCAGKTNSFDTLLMNKDKYYFNSGNNVYSTVPAAIFGPGYFRLIKQSLEWGRDTGVDGVIANYPIYTISNAIEFQGSSDEKLTNKSGRSFVGATGSTVYIGVVHSATAMEAAHTLHTMGIHNSLGLDNGGSTALWVGGYKAGPGRDIPNAILFVSK